MSERKKCPVCGLVTFVGMVLIPGRGHGPGLEKDWRIELNGEDGEVQEMCSECVAKPEMRWEPPAEEYMIGTYLTSSEDYKQFFTVDKNGVFQATWKNLIYAEEHKEELIKTND